VALALHKRPERHLAVQARVVLHGQDFLLCRLGRLFTLAVRFAHALNAIGIRFGQRLVATGQLAIDDQGHAFAVWTPTTTHLHRPIKRYVLHTTSSRSIHRLRSPRFPFRAHDQTSIVQPARNHALVRGSKRTFATRAAWLAPLVA